MKRSFLLPILAGLSLSLAATNAPAQEVRDNASLAFPVLSVGVGARAVGMGESFVCVADDPSALYWNPAGLTQLKEQQASFTHHSYVQGSMYETALYARPVGRGSGLGLSASYLNYGKFDRRDGSGAFSGQFAPQDAAFSTAYALSLGRKWSAGLRAGWMRQTIDDYAHTGLLWDIGFLSHPDGKFRGGVNLKNMGVETAGGRLPVEIKAGISYQIHVGDEDRHTLMYAVGVDVLPQSVSRANVGFEYCYDSHFCGRAGSIIDFGHNPQDWKKGLSLGAGGKLDRFQLDYAFTFGGDLGDSHRFTLTAFWGARTSTAQASAPPGVAVKGAGSSAMPVTLTFELPSPDCIDGDDCFKKALKLEKKNKKQEALRYYLKAVEKDKKQDAAWLRIGRLYYDLGWVAFEKALQANPNNEELRKWLKKP